MERELCALGKRSSEKKDQDRQVQLVRANEIARREHFVEVVAADDAAQDQHTREKAQAAARGDDESHARTFARRGVMVPVTDQQEGKETRELPEEDELNQIPGQYHAEHRAHESEQEGEEPRHGIPGRHVVARIKHHEKTDERDERREHPRVAVHPHDEIQPECRQPLELKANHVSASDIRVEP